jgi:hypothetical protein
MQSLMVIIFKTSDRLLEKNRGSISVRKPDPGFSGTVFDRDRDRDLDLKIGIRFQNENRGSILRLKSGIDFRTKIGIRFCVPSVLFI